MRDDDLKLGPQRLERLIAARVEHGADVEAIDRRIWELFGQRRAVLFTDLSGFSRNVEHFGILHFLQVIYEHRRLLYPIVDQHGGVLIKAEGDSLLLSFHRAQSALECAVAMRDTCNKVNARRKEEEQILLCQGLGYGDVLQIGDHDVWGREVNAASKLGEDTAKTNEILITAAFRAELEHLDDSQLERIVAVAGSAENYRYLG